MFELFGFDSNKCKGKKEKGIVHPGLASTWPSCLGWLGLGWKPTVKNRGGKGVLVAALNDGSLDVAGVPVASTGGEGG
jgi:hypothetical protein